MFSFLSEILQKNHINCFGILPLSACRITKPYLLEKASIREGSVILFAVPYFTPACEDPNRNVSAYAVGRNYHSFFDSLYQSILPQLEKAYPENRFVGFADHSPIAEVEAAARAGLGKIGKNGLLLTERYSSYIFLGEIITDILCSSEVHDLTFCEDCGLCRQICPIRECGVCLSALTQKKGILTASESASIQKFGSAWGCDLCQEVCPYTRQAKERGTIYTPIPYFYEKTIPHLTRSILDEMEDDFFAERAYSWRRRETVRRNLILLEEEHKEGEHR